MAGNVMGLKVQGIDELQTTLDGLGKRLGRSVLERALRKASAPMLAKAKSYAAFDEGDLEGSLKITRQTVSDPGKAAFAATLQAGGDRASAQAALRAAYRDQGGAVVDLVLGPDLADGGSTAHLVEFGTGPRYQKGGKYVGEMPAQPFLRPAFDAEAGPSVDRLKPLLMAEIEKAVQRRAARAARPVRTR
jgi:HK97 gp10 family phage protein